MTYNYNGQILSDEISLDDIGSYYKFKDHIGLYLFERLVDQKTVDKNIDPAEDLANGVVRYTNKSGNVMEFVIPTNIIY